MVITLFSNKIGEAFHLMPMLAEMPSGFYPRKWVKCVIDGYYEQGVSRGYIFQNQDNTKLEPGLMEPKFHLHLEKIKQNNLS